MEDITEKINKSIIIDRLWSINNYYTIIDTLISIKNVEVSYWEGEENWATILYLGNIIGYMWKMHPMVLATKPFLKIIEQSSIMKNSISLIIVNSLESKELIADGDIIDKYFQIYLEQPFSAEDLWFFTNSI